MDFAILILGWLLGAACLFIIHKFVHKPGKSGWTVTGVATSGFLTSVAFFGIATPKFHQLIIDFTKKKLELSRLEKQITVAKEEVQTLSKKTGEYQLAMQRPLTDTSRKVLQAFGNYYLGAEAVKGLLPKSPTEFGFDEGKWLFVIRAAGSSHGKPAAYLYSPTTAKIKSVEMNENEIDKLVGEIKKQAGFSRDGRNAHAQYESRVSGFIFI